MIKRAFNRACDTATFKPPRLWSFERKWQQEILPYVQEHTRDPELLRMAQETKNYIKNGWTLGITKKPSEKMNNHSYPDDMMGKKLEEETAIQLISEMNKGRIIPIKGTPNNIIAHFCIVKKRDEKTGDPVSYRWIRDGSHAGKGQKSLNDCTPDKNAEVRMPMILEIALMFYTMFLAWGAGFYIGKTDLSEAFRQLWLNTKETLYCVYKFWGRLFMDMCDIWGSRSGSKHTQEFGQLIATFLMMKINGENAYHQIEEIWKSENISTIDPFEGMVNDEVMKWGDKEIEKWLHECGLGEYEHISFITEGSELLKLKWTDVKNWCNSKTEKIV